MVIRRISVLLICLVASARIQLSRCLILHSRQQHRLATLVGSEILEYDHKSKQTKLLSKKDIDDETGESNESINGEKIIPPDMILLIDPGLWVSDFLAVILASQLIGLVEIINSPEFIENGGWFQPIPAVPSTLDDLVQRISSFSILWAVASGSVVFFEKTLASKRSGVQITAKLDIQDRDDVSVLMQRNIQALVAFGILQIITNGIMLGLDNPNELVNNNGFFADGEISIPFLETVRNCYYVGLTTSGLRFLYGRYFLL